MKIVKDDLLEVAEKYGDDRRTKIIKGEEAAFARRLGA